MASGEQEGLEEFRLTGIVFQESYVHVNRK
jgi:hypothetical protein